MNMQHELLNLWVKGVYILINVTSNPQKNQYKYWNSENVPRTVEQIFYST